MALRRRKEGLWMGKKKEYSPFKVVVVSSGKEADLRSLASTMLPRIIEWYKDPKHKEGFQQWLSEREKGMKKQQKAEE